MSAVARRGLLVTTALVGIACALPAGASAAKLGDRTLRKGMHGHDVRVMQRKLTTVGFETTADGAFGPSTKRELKRWERSIDRRANGVLSRRDARKLRRAARAEKRADDRDTAEPPDDGDTDDAAPGATSGGSDPFSEPEGPTGKAKLGRDGRAIAPVDAPQAVKDVIAAGNKIAFKPYIYGGGHGRWRDRGYDCSGSVSYALHGGGLLKSSMPSGSFESWGRRGKGDWITIYANAGHMYMVVAGLRYDTSGRSSDHSTRWHKDMRSNRGYVVRHPRGL